MGDEIVPDTVTHHADGIAAPGAAERSGLRRPRTTCACSPRSSTRRSADISLTSPYFVPDEPLLYAVTTAARRGVDVELFVSEEGDQFMVFHAQCSYYAALLEAGVRIYLYPAPAVLHSKYFSIDDDVAVIGSSNMDMRSFALNYEVSLMLTGGDIVQRFREVEDTYREAVARAHARGVVAVGRGRRRTSTTPCGSPPPCSRTQRSSGRRMVLQRTSDATTTTSKAMTALTRARAACPSAWTSPYPTVAIVLSVK